MTLDIDGLQVERTSLSKERTRLATARNQLAIERTFLSWVRTGLAIIGGGIAIARLLPFARPAHKFSAEAGGAILVALGILMFVLSAADYYKSSRQLQVQGWAGSIWSVMIISAVLVIVAVLLAFILTNIV